MSRSYYEIGLRVGEEIPQTQRTSADGADSIAMMNADNSTKDLDERINALAKTWNPTGYYRVDELQKTMNETINLMREAQRAVNDAPRSTGDSEMMIKQAIDRLIRNGQQAMVFVEKIRTAKPGALVEAPTLKDWVLRSLINCSQAYSTLSVLKENTPWYVGAIAKFKAMFDIAIKIIEQAGKIVWDGVEALLNVPINAAKSLGWGALKIAGGIAAVAGLGYIAVKKFGNNGKEE